MAEKDLCSVCKKYPIKYSVLVKNEKDPKDSMKYGICGKCVGKPDVFITHDGWSLTEKGNLRKDSTLRSLKEKTKDKKVNFDRLLEEAFIEGADLVVKKVLEDDK